MKSIKNVFKKMVLMVVNLLLYAVFEFWHLALQFIVYIPLYISLLHFKFDLRLFPCIV